jgi:methylmalonyl-CoA/ethylmalonyl-CoA epimerase
MKLGRLNHIGVATPSIADSIAFYRDVMGATTIHTPFDLEEQDVKVCFVGTTPFHRLQPCHLHIIRSL